jgi:hypothetical protein
MLCAPFFHARPLLSRWFVLSVYTLFAGMQGMVWAVPGAVSGTYTVGGVYCLSGDTVQLYVHARTPTPGSRPKKTRHEINALTPNP